MNALNTILYHYGLELRATLNAEQLDDNDCAKEQFTQLLPMHSVTKLMNFLSLSIIERMEKMTTNQHCSYGTGQKLTTISSKREHKSLASLCKATTIDIYYSSDKKAIQKCQQLTLAFLFSLFDVNVIQVAKKPDSMKIQDFVLDDLES
jgi:hypothetical protein